VTELPPFCRRRPGYSGVRPIGAEALHLPEGLPRRPRNPAFRSRQRRFSIRNLPHPSTPETWAPLPGMGRGRRAHPVTSQFLRPLSGRPWLQPNTDPRFTRID